MRSPVLNQVLNPRKFTFFSSAMFFTLRKKIPAVGTLHCTITRYEEIIEELQNEGYESNTQHNEALERMRVESNTQHNEALERMRVEVGRRQHPYLLLTCS